MRKTQQCRSKTCNCPVPTEARYCPGCGQDQKQVAEAYPQADGGRAMLRFGLFVLAGLLVGVGFSRVDRDVPRDAWANNSGAVVVERIQQTPPAAPVYSRPSANVRTFWGSHQPASPAKRKTRGHDPLVIVESCK